MGSIRKQTCRHDEGRVRTRTILTLTLSVAWCVMPPVMPSKAAADAGRGEPLYQRYCSGCHGVDGQGGAKNFMPHVGALTKKGYIDLLEDEYLAMVIAEGGEAVGKSAFMPSWKTTLSKQDIADVIEYIRRLPLY